MRSSTKDRFRSSHWAAVSIAALVALAPLPLCGHPGEGHTDHDHGKPSAAPRADIEEELGMVIPAGLAFADEDGKAVELKSKLTRPTILALVFYGCTGECNLVLDNLAAALARVPQKPGAEFQVVAVSFDESETQPMARRKKDNVMNILGPAFPRDAWPFLVGDKTNIEALTQAIGFHFIRKDGGFVHPTGLVFIAPGGKVVRYLHGTQYLPAEISLALTEAETGRTGVSARKMLSYCFSYDPASRRYTVNFLRISGAAIAVGMVILLVVLLRPRGKGKTPPAKGPGDA